MSNHPTCPCETFLHPQVIANPPGQSVLAYRVGDYLTFRRALLLSLPGETELTAWHPAESGDLALQLLEWWAYLADILTFYNERIANQAYLRSADQPESVQRLIRTLGYRPRPGIAARGTLAALMSKPTPCTLPQGLAIQSKPGPGQQPQIFELDNATPIAYPDALAVNVQSSSPTPLTNATSVLLQGSVSTVKVGDELLFIGNAFPDNTSDFLLATVQNVQPEKDPSGNTNTRITFSHPNPLGLSGSAADYRLMKSVQSTQLWTYPSADPTQVLIDDNLDPEHFTIRIFVNDVHLVSVTRQIKVGDPVLFVYAAGTPSTQLVSITGCLEVVWYANTTAGQTPDPTKPPTEPTVPGVPIPHTQIKFTPPLPWTFETLGSWTFETLGRWTPDSTSLQQALLQKTLIRYAWQDVGQLIETPNQTVTGPTISLSPASPITLNVPVILEDATGQGVEASVTISSTSSADTSSQLLTAHLSDPSITLTQPLNVLSNLLSVSRGKTVSNEIVGSGDATVAGQEFALQKSPLTYRLSSNSTSGNSYTSTLRVWVNSIEWQEVPSFYAQPATACIFVTREDAQNVTYVQFGDGINGARLPSGTNNVVAQYRYGSGAAAPSAGQLTVITQPWPNLKAIRNPIAVGGGADPDPADQICRYAPQSVLTFGRAISGDDYETVAAQAPGVKRAKAYWTWDADQQRSLVKIYVGDDAHAVVAAQVALNAAEDPNRQVIVTRATAASVQLSLALRLDPALSSAPIVTAVTAALLDDDSGLFGTHRLGIGQSIYQSQIYAACMSVPGVLAVHSLDFTVTGFPWFVNGILRFQPISVRFGFLHRPSERYSPAEGGFFQLSAYNLRISVEGSHNG